MGLTSRSSSNLQALETPLLDPTDEATQPLSSPQLPPGLTPRSDRQESQCESFFAESLAGCLQAAETDDEDGLGVKHVDYYKWDWALWALTTLGTIVTAGMLLLAFRWMPIWALKCRHRKSTAEEATCVLIHSTDGTQTVVEICSGSDLQHDAMDEDLPRFFTFRHLRYFEVGSSFVPLSFNVRQPYTSLLKHAARGLSTDDVYYRQAIFGFNLADVPVKPHFQLLLDEILHPFYVFQIWSVVVWYLEPYILYATAIAVISVFSALVSLFSTRKNLLNIRQMAHFECPVTVHRRKGNEGRPLETESISSKYLVPGDVVEIDDHMTFPCDIIICSGSVVVNESMLTGESLPVLKASLPLHTDHEYCSEKDKRFTLWAGTKALEARPLGKSKVLGVVFRTGFMTTKGRLVRSILFPKPSNLKFYEDSFKFVAVLSVMAVAGFLWSIRAFNKYGVDLRDVILNACDIVTIAVPPALPAAMTIGTEFALERLKKMSIFCISPNRVNISGQLDTLCFDKTGTLTEDGVDVMGVLPVAKGYIERLTNVCDAPLRFLQCLACCHGLTDVDGQLIGDPLDLKMFAATGWILKEPSGEDKEESWMPTMIFPPGTQTQGEDGEIPDGGMAVVRRFDFTSNHQRMSVIARTHDQKGCHVFLKGAPEVVRDLCDQNTIPSDFLKVVHSHSREGLRLLACAHKYEKSLGWHHAQRVTRERAETGLSFIGILILENRLKSETAAVIEELKKAQIECCMITGDHALTGVAVSKKSGLIDSTRPVYMAEITSLHAPPPTSMHNARSAGFLEAPSSPATKGAGFMRSRSEREMPSEIEGEEEEEEDAGIELHGIHMTSSDHAVHFEETVHDHERRDSHATSIAAVRSVVGMEQKVLNFHLLDEDTSGPLNLSLESMLEALSAQQKTSDFEIAINGPSFEYLHKMAKQGDPEPLYLVMERAKVYARMSPEQKQLLIELFADEHRRIVGMCGDGANDCGALKAAHVGLSLSDAEASIAAPFTSSITNIRPLLDLMREGRAALVTSISCFKFMALYSTIQFITVLRLYQINSNMSDFQYLWIDLFIIFPLAVYMARTGPYHKLSKQRPQGRLISFPVLTSVLGQTLIAGAFQAFAAWWTLQMKGFKCNDACPAAGDICNPAKKNMESCCAFLPLGCPTKPILSDTDDNEKSVEASSAFLFSQFQYLAVVIAFNTSKPFRRSIVTNSLFFSCFVVLSICSTFLLVGPDPLIQDLNHMITSLEMERFPSFFFKWKLAGLAAVNAVVTYAFECVVEWIAKKRMSMQKSIGVALGSLFLLLALSLVPCAVIPVLRYT